MCLDNSKEDVEKFIKKCKSQNKTYIWVYKYVSFYKNNLVGPYRNRYKYKVGWNRSSSKRTSPYYKNQYVSLGIHVASKPNMYYLGELIKVKCYLKDLIGVSQMYVSGREFVFSKIWIPKKEYDKVMLKYQKISRII